MYVCMFACMCKSLLLQTQGLLAYLPCKIKTFRKRIENVVISIYIILYYNMCVCGFCNVCVCVCICGFCMFVCVGFIMCGCVYVWVLYVCGFCNVCVCVCVVFVMCGCVYVWVLYVFVWVL